MLRIRPMSIAAVRVVSARGRRRLFRHLLLLVAMMFVSGSTVHAGPFAYITAFDSARVVVLDAAVNEWTSINVGNAPVGVAVNPFVPRVYVTNRDDGTVSVIDSSLNVVVTTIPVGLAPEVAILTNDGATLYVANRAEGSVSVIDTAAEAVVSTITTGGDIAALAVNPADTRLYVGKFDTQRVSVFNTTTLLQVAEIFVGTQIQSMAMHPDGTRLYVGASASRAIQVINPAINLVTNTFAPPRYLNNFGCDTPVASAMRMSDDGSVLYIVFDEQPSCTNSALDTVRVITTSDNTQVALLGVGGEARGVDLSPDGTRLFVANFLSDTVSVFDTATNSLLANVIVVGGTGPLALGRFMSDTPLVSTTTTITTSTTTTTFPGSPPVPAMSYGGAGSLGSLLAFAMAWAIRRRRVQVPGACRSVSATHHL